MVVHETSESNSFRQDTVFSLAVSPTFAKDGICFAARTSGLYRTMDGGATWRLVCASPDNEKPLPATAVVVSPDFDTDRAVFTGSLGQVLRSFDEGETCYAARLPLKSTLVSCMVVSPAFAEDGTLLIGTFEDGVLRSTDRGTSWTSANSGLLDPNVLSMAISGSFGNDGTVFIGTESGLFQSTNDGLSWKEVAFSDDLAPVLSLALSPSYRADGTVFAGTENAGLYRSVDGGQHWKRLGEHTVEQSVNGIVLALDFPTNPDVLVLHGSGLLCSQDGGHSWSEWKAGVSVEHGAISVAAPSGIRSGAPLLVGSASGSVTRF